MAAYFLRRFLLLIPTFLGLTVLVFAITRFVPGGPVEQMLARAQGGAGEGRGSAALSRSSQSLDESQIAELRAFYGLDKPVLQSYGMWLGKTLQFDFGTSTRYQEPVRDLILDRLPVTLSYGAVTLCLLYFIAIPLGVFKAVRHGSFADAGSSVFLFVLQSVPSFVIGLLLLVVLSVKLDLFPMSGFASDNFAEMSFSEKLRDLLWHGILPIVSYVVGLLAFLTFLMKNALLENLSADFVRTAVAKGAPFGHSVRRHAFRNSLVSLTPYVGSSVGILVGGSFLVETIFTIDGLGLLGYDALIQRDYPTVMGILVVTATMVLAGNLFSDFLLAVVDPRVKFQ
jgi:microcin C transport system permease protein